MKDKLEKLKLLRLKTKEKVFILYLNKRCLGTTYMEPRSLHTF